MKYQKLSPRKHFYEVGDVVVADRWIILMVKSGPFYVDSSEIGLIDNNKVYRINKKIYSSSDIHSIRKVSDEM